MDILSVRNQIKREGINFKSLPLRVAFYAGVPMLLIPMLLYRLRAWRLKAAALGANILR